MGGADVETLTIGIAGGTGSGKTTISKRIISEFQRDISVIHHDNYYKAHNDMPYEQRCRLNYDHPNAFDTRLLLKHLRMLKKGRIVRIPTYDYTIHNRAKKTLEVYPARVLLLEGILLFAEPELCRELDIKIYVDADADVRVLRRIVRDVRDRGRTLESVIDQYLNTVKPMHEQFVEPSKRNADIIIPQGGYNTVALELVLERIRSYIQKT